jgi:predicted ATPase
MSEDVEQQELEPVQPKRLLVDWANKQDSWVRRLVGHAMATRRAISANEAEELYDLFLAEKGIEGEAAAEPMLDHGNGTADATAALRLLKLRGVKGVNALTTGYAIEFSEGLTILFGENGTGKTGYARILKRLAAVRQAEDIIQDINAVKPESPQATVDYRLGDEELTLDWHDEAGVAPFTRMSVFDAPAVNLHVDENLGYVYTPADLSLFSYVTSGIRNVQERGEAAVRELTTAANPYLQYFERGSPIYAAVETLGASTDLESLARMASLPESAADERARLEREVAALRTDTVEAVLGSQRESIRTLESLEALAQSLADFDCDAYNEAVSGLAAVQENYRRVREDTFSSDELPGTPDDEWQAFVTTAAQYQAHIGAAGYPHEGDRCVYCRQELGTAAIKLIKKYAEFLDDALGRQVAERQRSVATLGTTLTELAVSACREAVRRQTESGAADKLYGPARVLLQTLSTAQLEASEGVAVTTSTLANDAVLLLNELGPVLEKRRKEVEELTQQLTDRRKALETSSGQLAHLTAQIELDRHLPEIETHVARAKRAASIKTLLARFPNVLRSLTEVSKVASQELVNHDFEQRFAEECKALRTPKIKLEFVGREGKAERRKTLTSKYRLSQILSEGEQKVIALADFIAEARLGDSSAPIVFDDPVNSLDHRRLEEVAKRIASLVDNRQVIVFTHDIWLATDLLALFEGRTGDCVYFAVTDDETSGAKGRIDRASGPRWDTEKELGRRIAEGLGEAAKASGETQSALVESTYGTIRSWCEVVVEQVLFASVARRYRANIMMGKLKEVKPDRLQPAMDVVGEIFDKACRYMPDHSQPLERLSKRATLAEATSDWNRLQEALKAYRVA